MRNWIDQEADLREAVLVAQDTGSQLASPVWRIDLKERKNGRHGSCRLSSYGFLKIFR